MLDWDFLRGAGLVPGPLDCCNIRILKNKSPSGTDPDGLSFRSGRHTPSRSVYGALAPGRVTHELLQSRMILQDHFHARPPPALRGMIGAWTLSNQIEGHTHSANRAGRQLSRSLWFSAPLPA